MAHVDMVGLIDFMSKIILQAFPDQFSQAYFGDVGIYPPKAFQGQTGEMRSVLVFQPLHDNLENELTTPASECRTLGINVAVLVNMTPFFEALPMEAFGERMLVEQVTKVRGFLSRDINFTLGGRVLSTSVGDVNWTWQQRGNNAIRAAAITYEAKVMQPRM